MTHGAYDKHAGGVDKMSIKVFIDSEQIEFTNWKCTQVINVGERGVWEKSKTEAQSSFEGQDASGQWWSIPLCMVAFGEDTLRIRTQLHSYLINNDRP